MTTYFKTYFDRIGLDVGMIEMKGPDNRELKSLHNLMRLITFFLNLCYSSNSSE